MPLVAAPRQLKAIGNAAFVSLLLNDDAEWPNISSANDPCTLAGLGPLGTALAAAFDLVPSLSEVGDAAVAAGLAPPLKKKSPFGRRQRGIAACTLRYFPRRRRRV